MALSKDSFLSDRLTNKKAQGKKGFFNRLERA
jgi:hypothetical protein